METYCKQEIRENAPNELSSIYSQCLELSQNYIYGCFKNEFDEGEIDLEALESFLNKRAEYLKLTELELEACPQSEIINSLATAILNEISETNAFLNQKLNDYFNKMKATIDHMHKSQTALKHYGRLNGHIVASRLSRHE